MVLAPVDILEPNVGKFRKPVGLPKGRCSFEIPGGTGAELIVLCPS